MNELNFVQAIKQGAVVACAVFKLTRAFEARGNQKL